MMTQQQSLYFNENLKNEFLSMYPETTQHVYKRIFVKSASNEVRFGKDLFDFDLELIEDVLTDLDPLTPTVSQTNGRIVSAYITWAIDKGYKKNKINLLKSVEAEYFSKFVDKSKKIYFSYDEIMDAEKFCENAQDSVVIRLLFENVQGKEASEIRNLRNEDGMIDWDNNTLTLVDKDGSKRTVEVSDRAMYLIEEALAETTYYKRNGMMEERDNVREFTDLMDNNYVIRNSITKSKNVNGAVNEWVIYRRVTLIGELLSIPYFTTKNIVRSGMIYMAYQLLKKDGKLEKEQYVQIAERFRIKNWYTLKEYCNLEIIEGLYGDVKVNSPE
jgi:integrase